MRALLLALALLMAPAAQAGAVEADGGCRAHARAAVEATGARFPNEALQEEYVACMAARGYLGAPVTQRAERYYAEGNCVIGGDTFRAAFILAWVAGMATFFGVASALRARFEALWGPALMLRWPEGCLVTVSAAAGICVWLGLARIAQALSCA